MKEREKTTKKTITCNFYQIVENSSIDIYSLPTHLKK